MYTSIILAAGLAGFVQAQSYTAPGANTFGALYTPNTQESVTQGQSFKVTWDPTGHTSDTISLVLCHGPSSNCVNSPNAIVTGIPASQAYYNWNVPCTLATGVQQTATGYGMLIIADGSGDFQYSTQFSVLAGASCAGTNTTSSTTTATTTSKSSTASSITSSGWSTWATMTSAANNYTMTSVKPTTPTSLKASTTSAYVTGTISATTTMSASASPSLFQGAASKIGGGAAAVVVAAGAAFFAL